MLLVSEPSKAFPNMNMGGQSSTCSIREYTLDIADPISLLTLQRLPFNPPHTVVACLTGTRDLVNSMQPSSLPTQT